MKLAVAAVLSIALCLLSLSLRHAYAPATTAPAQPAGRAPHPRVAAEKRALASIDQRLHRKLRQLATSGSAKSAPVVVVAAAR